MQSIKKQYFQPKLEQLQDFVEDREIIKIIESKKYNKDQLEKLLRSKNNLAKYLCVLHN